ncbi:MAG: tryptophan synthase subunit alpha, partial [Gammaproteobacteria bacterium]
TAVTDYLDKIKGYTNLPVCAGFGVRHAEQVQNLGNHASGVIVGSALVEKLEAGQNPARFLVELRA